METPELAFGEVLLGSSKIEVPSGLFNKSVYIMKFSFFFSIALLLSSVCFCETTPLDQKIQEGSITTIECEYQGNESKMMKGVNYFPKKGTFHYKVYLPTGYHSNPDKHYFCLFSASPGGNAGMFKAADWLKRNEWIVIMLVESKNGPTEPNLGNFLAAHDDAIKRFRIQEGFKFGTGFSGGARFSSIWPLWRPGFSGLILQGAGYWWNKNGYYYESAKANKNLLIYGIFGDKDGNSKEIKWMQSKLPKHTMREFASFPGGHSSAPKVEMEAGLEWVLNNTFYKTKFNSKNEKFIISFFSDELKRAEGLDISLEKYNKLEKIYFYTKTYRIKKLGDKDNISNYLKTLIDTLKKNPNIKNEIMSKDSFNKTEYFESKIRAKVKNKKALSRQLVLLYRKYRSIHKKYPDTEYGVKSKEKAEAIKNEVSSDKK